MTAWWSDNHPRLETERSAVERLCEKHNWFDSYAWELDDRLSRMFHAVLIKLLFVDDASGWPVSRE